MKTIHFTPHQILVATTVDAMNRYVNQVLIPANIIDKDKWSCTHSGAGSDLCKGKYNIAEDIADNWGKVLAARIDNKRGYVIGGVIGAVVMSLAHLML